MNFFGYFKNTDLLSFSEEEKIELFVSKGLFISSRVLSLPFNKKIPLFNPNEAKIIEKSTDELSQAYYVFLTNTYKEQIDNVIADFYHLFHNDIFTLKRKKAKQIARTHYLKITQHSNSPKFNIQKILENEKGIQHIENTPKIEMYSYKRDALRTRVISEYSNGLDNFLMGIAKHFTNTLSRETCILKEIIHFESNLKILSLLNEEYGFEEIPIVKIKAIEKETPDETSTLIQKRNTNGVMPSEEEIDAYILKYVFSKKD